MLEYIFEKKKGSVLSLISFTVKENELVPGFTALEFEERRRRLVQKLPDKSAVVSISSPIKYMSGGKFPVQKQSSRLKSCRDIVGAQST